MGFWKTFLGFDPNREKAFPGHQPGEEVQLMTVFHWVTLVPFFMELLVFVVIVITLNVSEAFRSLSSESRFYVNTIAIALIIHLLCFRLYNYFLRVIIVTNYRLIDIRHSVFLKREQEDIAMSNIQDCHFQQRGLFPRIFKYGDLIILGTNADIRYTFHSLPGVAKIHNLINVAHHSSLHGQPAAGAAPNHQQGAPTPPPTA